MFALALSLLAFVTYVPGSRLAFRVLGWERPTRHWWLPWLAAVTLTMAWFLPAVKVSAGSDTFLLHAVGGGCSVALMAFFVSSNRRVSNVGQRLAITLAMVSVLGVANEILELIIDHLAGTYLTADSASDLLANTVGACVAFAVIELVVLLRVPHQVA